ncbi:MAG: putative transporter [Methanosaeta sp. PtaU1.Bin112]|nr:MAG: putative transporter [Methanosaeta sp. PtaU1.Bin112]
MPEQNKQRSAYVIIEGSDSPLAALGYAAPYAFANVLLTVCGSLIVNLM